MTTNLDRARVLMQSAIQGEIPAEDIDRIMHNMQRAGLIAPERLAPTHIPDGGGSSWEIGQVAIYNWEDGGESICIQIGDFGFKFDLESTLEIANALISAVFTSEAYRHG